MKKVIIVAALLVGTLYTYAQSSIQGLWNTGKQNTIVKITEANNTIEGKILSSDNSKAPLGKLILKDVKATEEGSYKGKLYSVKIKRWFDASFTAKEQQLIVNISAGWRNKTVEWKKTK